MEWVFFWFIGSIIVGVAASARGRDGFGWFLFAALLSPLLGLLLVLVLPRPNSVFRPDGMLGQTPFRTLPSGEVEALLQGAPVRFRNVAELQLMVSPGATVVSTAPPARPASVAAQTTIVVAGVVAALLIIIRLFS